MVKVTKLASIRDLKNEGLREEAEGWSDENPREQILYGTAVMVPDDGSGPMEGFLCTGSDRGMIAWGDVDGELSNWIEAGSLKELFERYCSNFG